jgi:hypothetical protein
MASWACASRICAAARAGRTLVRPVRIGPASAIATAVRPADARMQVAASPGFLPALSTAEGAPAAVRDSAAGAFAPDAASIGRARRRRWRRWRRTPAGHLVVPRGATAGVGRRADVRRAGGGGGAGALRSQVAGVIVGASAGSADDEVRVSRIASTGRDRIRGPLLHRERVGAETPCAAAAIAAASAVRSRIRAGRRRGWRGTRAAGYPVVP